ncbi:trypsin-3-like [Polypterus senegalus]|uniref:trypsin-3-like n=1 Tax=Polypterus senegalus TaxID=55291 RepID=UPI00196525F2|nr:trypsin-3-like [Polypterus senegalus]
MKIIIFTVLVGWAAAASLPENDERIINGYECRPHSQPWQVYLTYNNGNRWCGGSLINQWWVLSAAHCYKPASSLEVHLGEHDTTRAEGTEQHLPVSRAIMHPEYNSYNLNNDIMLIKLARPAQYTQYVQPIMLPRSCVSAGTWCLVSGWGNLRTDGVQYPKALQCLDQPIIDDATCRRAYPPYFTENMMCSGFMEGGKSSCQGDSGGPLICNGELQGIVSWGYECAQQGHPSVYVRVCRYNSWISSVMASN